MASGDDAKHEYGVELTELDGIYNADCIIIAVAHDMFRAISFEKLNQLFRNVHNNKKVLIDVKGIYSIDILEQSGVLYWRL